MNKITSNKITSNQITSNQITSNEITTNEITSNEITAKCFLNDKKMTNNKSFLEILRMKDYRNVSLN